MYLISDLFPLQRTNNVADTEFDAISLNVVLSLALERNSNSPSFCVQKGFSNCVL